MGTKALHYPPGYQGRGFAGQAAQRQEHCDADEPPSSVEYLSAPPPPPPPPVPTRIEVTIRVIE